MYLLPESVIGNGPAMSKAILSNGAPTLRCFIRAPCSLHMSHICDTKSQCHPGHLSSRSVRVFFPKSWISCRTSFTRHLGRTSCFPIDTFPCTFQEAVFYSEGIPLGPQRLKSWALIRNLLPTGPLVPILFRSQNLDDIAVF
jgi:hypothetical protein